MVRIRTIRIWDFESGDELRSLKQPTPVKDVEFTPEGTHVVAAATHVTIWDAATGVLLHTFESDIAWVGGSATVWCCRQRQWPDCGRVQRRDQDLGCNGLPRLVRLTRDTDKPSDLAFSPTGDRIAAGGIDGAVTLWDVETGNEILTLHNNERVTRFIAFSPDGREMITGHAGRVHVWPSQPPAGVAAQTPRPVEDPARKVVEEPVRPGQTTRPSTGPLITLSGHQHNISALALTPDGRWLLSGESRQDGEALEFENCSPRSAASVAWTWSPGFVRCHQRQRTARRDRQL